VVDAVPLDAAIRQRASKRSALSSNARTAHAERLIASRAARTYDLAFLDRCTLYTSAEPCATCAGAIYWTGIGRVVYGQSEKALKEQIGAHEENPTLDLPRGLVFAAGQRRPKSWARCLRTKPLDCRRIFRRRGDSRFRGRRFGVLVHPRASENWSTRAPQKKID
jgi:tRNA(Arg) A34 adenosine deaminase TadA